MFNHRPPQRNKAMTDQSKRSKCVPFCKGDTSNRLLDKVMTPQQHEAFV